MTLNTSVERSALVHKLAVIRLRSNRLMTVLGEQSLGRSLQALGWTIQFDRARRRLGVCRWEQFGRRVRVISLSRYYATRVDWSQMEDVVRHEIAHAIDFETRGTSDHGPIWMAIARRVGADPTRLYDGPDVPDAGSKYVGLCPSCEKEHPFYRRVSRVHACPDCCAEHNGGRFAARFRLRIVERETGLDVSPHRLEGGRCAGGADR